MRANLGKILLVAAIVIGAAPGVVRAFTIATPAVEASGSGHSFKCVITNLHASSTCQLQAGSGLYLKDRGQPLFPSVGTPTQSMTFSLPAGHSLSSNSYVMPNLYHGLCYFKIKGCPKAAVRAGIIYDDGATLPAY
jgi:hypothetical protein